MNIEIDKIINSGVLDKERIVFSVNEDDSLGGYLTFKAKRITGQDKLSSKIGEPYWFPDKDVKKGDVVILYTKKGVNSQVKNPDNTTSYFFYWDKGTAVWKEVEDTVLLMRVANWRSKALLEK